MWKSDFQILVPFVKSDEVYDCSFTKEVNLKKSLELLPTVCKKQGKDIRKFYEDLVNSDETISPWGDSVIQNKDTLISESLHDNINDNGKNSKYLKRKLDSSASSSTKHQTTVNNNTSPISSTTNTNSSTFKRGNNYKTELNITPESLGYSTNKGKSSTSRTCLKNKLDYSASSKTKIVTPSTSDTTTNTNSPVVKRGYNYKTKLNTTVPSIVYNTNNGKSSTCLKRKLDSGSTKSQAANTNSNTPSSTSSATTTTNNTDSSVLDIINYKTKPNIEMPSNSKPLFCRDTDDIVRKFSQEHIQNSVLRCAQEGDLPALKQHLKFGSVDVNCTDSFGWTPLMCASFGGHVDVVKFLLSLDGVDDRYRNHKGQSALGLSAKGEHRHIRKLLENHRRGPVVSSSSSSSSSYKKGKSREKSSSQKQDQSPSLAYEYFCDVCRMPAKNTTKSAHESSTVHLLNLHPKPLPESYFLSEQNRGFQMMVKTGWDESKGLGPSGEGRRIPIKTVLKRDRKGLGVKTSNVAKISHFDAKDTKAVVHRRTMGIKALNKRKLASMQKREKQKERYLRRCLDFN